ncbi:MAG: TetR/AcrR family transcriptional regulator [Melioribacteraceae bacterium]|nr:TetR/AcrR family transcriptional regulator [Melioribacteraceae bacterium]
MNIEEHHVHTDTKYKIMQAAAELIARDGYHKVSVREICDAAGVTKPVLYYYFTDKEALLKELMNETAYHANELKNKYIHPDQTLEEILRNIINLYVDFIENYPHLVKFSALIQSTNVPPRIRQMKLERYKVELGNFVKLLERFQAKGVIDQSHDAKLLARNFLGSIMIIILECVMLEDQQCELRDQLNNFVEFWIRNFLKK